MQNIRIMKMLFIKFGSWRPDGRVFNGPIWLKWVKTHMDTCYYYTFMYSIIIFMYKAWIFTTLTKWLFILNCELHLWKQLWLTKITKWWVVKNMYIKDTKLIFTILNWIMAMGLLFTGWFSGQKVLFYEECLGSNG